jgi:hypothetical protein
MSSTSLMRLREQGSSHQAHPLRSAPTASAMPAPSSSLPTLDEIAQRMETTRQKLEVLSAQLRARRGQRADRHGPAKKKAAEAALSYFGVPRPQV